MKTMRIYVVLWVLVLGLIAAFQATVVKAQDSPFKGRWEGAYTAKLRDIVQTGTCTLTIAANGTFEGGVDNKTNNRSWEWAGTIDNDGNMTGETLPPTKSTLKGTTVKTEDGKLKGTWKHIYPDGLTWDLEILLSPKE